MTSKSISTRWHGGPALAGPWPWLLLQLGPGWGKVAPRATHQQCIPFQRYHEQIFFFNLTYKIQKMHAPWFFYSALERQAKKTLLGRPLWHFCSALHDKNVCRDVGGTEELWIVPLYIVTGTFYEARGDALM